MKRQVKKGFLGVLIAVATMAITLFAGGCKKTNVDEWFCDHKYNDGIVIVDSGCTTDGTLERTCTECGKKKNEPIIAVGHEFDEGVVEKEPSCTETGMEEYTCSRCGEVKTEILPTTAHNKITFAGTPATCTETGMTEGWKCASCNTVLLAQSVIPAKGHKRVDDFAVFPTCTTTGLTYGYHCEWCNEVLQAQEVLEALGHNIVTVEGYEATCQQTGLTNGAKCDRCHTVYTEQEKISVVPHDFINGVCQVCDITSSFFTSLVGENVSGRRIAFAHCTSDNELVEETSLYSVMTQMVDNLGDKKESLNAVEIGLSTGETIIIVCCITRDANDLMVRMSFCDSGLNYDETILIYWEQCEFGGDGDIFYDRTIEDGTTVVSVNVYMDDPLFSQYIVNFLNISAGGVTV